MHLLWVLAGLATDDVVRDPDVEAQRGVKEMAI
jgi:hypothetical protein